MNREREKNEIKKSETHRREKELLKKIENLEIEKAIIQAKGKLMKGGKKGNSVQNSKHEETIDLENKNRILSLITEEFGKGERQSLEILSMNETERVEEKSNKERETFLIQLLKNVLDREHELLQKRAELREFQSTFINKAQEKQKTFEKLQDQIKKDQNNIRQKQEELKDSEKTIQTRLEGIHDSQRQIQVQSK